MFTKKILLSTFGTKITPYGFEYAEVRVFCGRIRNTNGNMRNGRDYAIWLV